MYIPSIATEFSAMLELGLGNKYDAVPYDKIIKHYVYLFTLCMYVCCRSVSVRHILVLCRNG